MTQKLLLSSLLFFIFSISAQAQYYKVSLDKKVTKSNLIIEGEVVESTPFSPDEGKVFTSHKILIRNIIHSAETLALNNIEQGQHIYIITRGGRTDETMEIWAHALNLYPENLGLFFLTNSSHPVLYPEERNYEVFAEKQGFVEYTTNSKGNFIGSSLFVNYDSPEVIFSAIYDALGFPDPQLQSTIRDEWELHYKLGNISVDFSTINFDVSMKSRWGNLFTIDDITIGLKYDTEVFGTNILSNINTDISLDASLAFSGIQKGLFQAAQNEVHISLQNTIQNPTYFFGDSYQKVLSLQLPIENWDFTTAPYFEIITNYNTSPQSFKATNSTTFTPTDTHIEIDKYPFFGVCSTGGIDITSFTPVEAAAGVLDTLSQNITAGTPQYSGIITITGCGFGDVPEDSLATYIPSQYRVLFTTLDTTKRVTPFALDYIKWDSTEIKVRVPSVGYEASVGATTTIPVFGLSASTGPIIVRKPGPGGIGSLSDTSIVNLSVPFVHWNSERGTTSATHQSTRLTLKALDHLGAANNDGYEFIYTEAFKDSMPAGSVGAVYDALETWRCDVRVNFDTVAMRTDPVGRGVFDFGVTPAGLIADSRAVIQGNLLDCSAGTPPDYPPSELGVLFSNTISFSLISAPAVGSYHLESVALHELGHNTLLGHVALNNATMFPNSLSGTASVDTTLATDDISGGQHVVSKSSIDVLCGGFTLSGMVILPPCTTPVHEVYLYEGITISPNPTSGSFTITSENKKIEEIVIISSSGKVLSVDKDIQESREHRIDKHLPAGMYIIHGTVDGGIIFSKKIIVVE